MSRAMYDAAMKEAGDAIMGIGPSREEWERTAPKALDKFLAAVAAAAREFACDARREASLRVVALPDQKSH